MKKILMILTTLKKSDGVASFCMNYYSHINHDKFKVDFVVHNDEVYDDYRNLIEQSNDKIFVLPFLSPLNFKDIKSQFLKILNDENYDVCHCNLSNMAFIYLKLAKEKGVKERIIHSHASKFSDSKLKSIRNYLLWKIGEKYANKNLACSNLAGKFLFKRGKFTVVNNCISFDRFKYDFEKRKTFRNEFGINDNDIVFACIGRISKQKNQLFIVKNLAKLLPNSKFYFAGSNVSDKYYEKFKIDLPSNCIYLGSLDKVDNLLNGSDVLLMPSKFEGLPVTAIEAQATGLTCFLSDKITKEVNLGLCSFLKLNAKTWKEKITLGKLPDRVSGYFEEYDIGKQVKKLESIYNEEF